MTFERIKERLAEWDSAASDELAYTAYARTGSVLQDLRWLVRAYAAQSLLVETQNAVIMAQTHRDVTDATSS